MSRTQQAIGSVLILAAAIGHAADPQETATFFHGPAAYPAEVTQWPRTRIESVHPELLRAPSIGDGFAFRVCRGTNRVREITGTIAAADILECDEGPEIHIRDQSVVDVFHALYMTDILHQSPQIEDDFTPERLDPGPQQMKIWTPADGPVPAPE